MKKLNLKTLNLGEALTRMQMKDIKGGITDADYCGPNGPMPNTFCITGDQGDDTNPCTPGWPMGGLVCRGGGICCSLLSS
jgi:hypothetical protein